MPSERTSVLTDPLAAAPTERAAAPNERAAAPTERAAAPSQRAAAPTERTAAPNERAAAPTERTKLHRKPARGSHDRAAIDAILDEAIVCHVAFPGGAVAPSRYASIPMSAGPQEQAAPIIIPTTHVRVGDTLYLHGSAASHMLRSLATGAEICVCVTLLDALVLARAAMHHSVNYRSVVLFGRARAVEDRAEKLAALAALIDHVVPGRSRACRPPNEKELVATLVVALPISEASAKARTGPPLPDDAEDAALPWWAGIVPLRTVRGTPETAPGCSVPAPW